MITEDFVSFETAKLLKEKGFKEGTYHCYTTKGVLWFDDVPVNHNAGIDYSVPTLQMAMKWLREKHNKFIEVCTDKSHNFNNIIFRPFVYNKELDCLWESDNFSTYEQACEAAIKYCLENLI